MFIDEVTIVFKAGRGGNGSRSFLHLPHKPKGGPDGGDGGRGGSIILVGDTNFDSLKSFNHIKEIKAENGEDGGKKKMHGKNADDKYVKVPVGTKIVEINPKNNHEFVLFEVLETINYPLVKGGRGGWGNVHFTSPTNQAPDFAVPGGPGEEKVVTLNLQMIADVGLIGLPNAGKSTLLAVISDAKPKIAGYAFTTLEPNLGVVRGRANNFIVADLPGLIEGASRGKGLGITFLKHIEKTKLLVHLIDSHSPTMDRDYMTVRRELEQFSETLKKKPELIVLTKVDSQDESDVAESTLKADLAISSATHFNIDSLLRLLEEKTSL